MEPLSQAICHSSDRFDPYHVFGYANWSDLVREIETAEKFVLDADMAAAVAHVATTKPSSMLSHLDFARSPYPKCWFECDYPSRQAATDPTWIHDSGPHKPAPWRLGCLIHSEPSGDHGIMHLFWQFKDGKTGASPIATFWDHRMHPLSRQEMVDWYTEHFSMGTLTGQSQLSAEDTLRQSQQGGFDHKYLHSPQELDAITEMHNRLAAVKSWLYKPIWDLIETKENNVLYWTSIREQIDSWMADLHGEPRYMLAFFCMLNTINSVETTEKDMSERNFFRRKKGKKPFHSYKILHLKLTKQQIQRATANGITSRSEMRMHLVRGHFKNRKTGRFWWSAFPRGSVAAGVVDKDYEVQK